jgi:hypothetical protein
VGRSGVAAASQRVAGVVRRTVRRFGLTAAEPPGLGADAPDHQPPLALGGHRSERAPRTPAAPARRLRRRPTPDPPETHIAAEARPSLSLLGARG